MSRYIGVAGYQCEIIAEKLKGLGLSCKSMDVSFEEPQVAEFLVKAAKSDVLVLIQPPDFSPGIDNIFYAQLGAALALDKECFVGCWHRPDNYPPNPFLLQTTIFQTFEQLSSCLSETC